MQESFNDVIIEKHLFSLGTDKVKDYIAHIYCDKGSCEVCFNDKNIEITSGDSAIFIATKLVSDVQPSKDFTVTVIYVSERYISLANPDNNYSVKGTIFLRDNPVMLLDKKHQQICKNDFQQVEFRFSDVKHNFYQEALLSSLRTLFIDYFDFHYRITLGHKNISSIQADLVSKFFNLLEHGDYKQHRDLTYYADKLCVSSKHLSQTCKQISGFSANYWINRFTVIELQRYLKDTSYSLSDIADIFCFSSQAYFSRYVYNNLGQYPSHYREK